MMRKRELEGLLNALIPHAERMLVEFGEFFPFAGVILQDGGLQTVANPEPDPNDSTEAWRQKLLAQLRKGATTGRYRAVGLVLNVEVDVPGAGATRALRVALEHESGVGYDVCIPYLREADGAVELGTAMAAQSGCQVFAYCVEPEPLPLEGEALKGAETERAQSRQQA